MPSHRETSSIFHRCSSGAPQVLAVKPQCWGGGRSKLPCCPGGPAGESGRGAGRAGGREDGPALGTSIAVGSEGPHAPAPGRVSGHVVPTGTPASPPQARASHPLGPSPATVGQAAPVSSRKLPSCVRILPRPLGPGRLPRPAGLATAGPALPSEPQAAPRVDPWDWGRGLHWLGRGHLPEGLTPRSHPSAGPGPGRPAVQWAQGPVGAPALQAWFRALLWFLAGGPLAAPSSAHPWAPPPPHLPPQPH
nr:vegetative cell wall protein gp1-like [Vulpes vulpes]